MVTLTISPLRFRDDIAECCKSRGQSAAQNSFPGLQRTGDIKFVPIVYSVHCSDLEGLFIWKLCFSTYIIKL